MQLSQPKNIKTLFIENANARVIWDVIMESDFFTSLSPNRKVEFQKQFPALIHDFPRLHAKAFANASLMDMNKRFIESIVHGPDLHASTHLATQPASQTPYTSQDIQQSRKQQFETDLALRKMEFDAINNVVIPNVPEFADKKDEPISEMEELIARTIAQRSFDINQIQQISSQSSNNTFLQPQETSIKAEKRKGNEETLKYIKIEKEETGNIYELPDIVTLNSPIMRNSNSVKSDKRVFLNENRNTNHYYESDNHVSGQHGNDVSANTPVNVITNTQVSVVKNIERFKNANNNVLSRLKKIQSGFESDNTAQTGNPVHSGLLPPITGYSNQIQEEWMRKVDNKLDDITRILTECIQLLNK